MSTARHGAGRRGGSNMVLTHFWILLFTSSLVLRECSCGAYSRGYGGYHKCADYGGGYGEKYYDQCDNYYDYGGRRGNNARQTGGGGGNQGGGGGWDYHW